MTDDPFKELTDRVGYIAGEGQIKAMQFYGEARYNRMVNMSDDRDVATTEHIRAKGQMFKAIGSAASLVGFGAFLVLVAVAVVLLAHV